MNQAIAKKPEVDEKQMAMIQTIRSAVFPSSTDAEMALYITKCKVTGVDPLSKRIIPIKFNSSMGAQVSFITTIDLLRSKAEESKEYDGSDEAEFGPLMPLVLEDGSEMNVPEYCKIRVYRKGMSRPIVGTARWIEYYPGHKRGQMWRQRPFAQLEKCAEAMALRKAFPERIDKLYTDEEMQNTVENLAITGNVSSKPRVSPDDVTVAQPEQPTATASDPKSYVHPTEEEIKAGKLVSDKQGWLMISECKKAGISPEAIANAAGVKNVFWLTWAKNSKVNFNVMLDTLKTQPNRFAQYEPAAYIAKEVTTSAGAGTQPEAMDSSDFETFCQTLCVQMGLSKEKASALLDAEFSYRGFEHVPASDQSKVVDWLQSLIDQAGA